MLAGVVKISPSPAGAQSQPPPAAERRAPEACSPPMGRAPASSTETMMKTALGGKTRPRREARRVPASVNLRSADWIMDVLDDFVGRIRAGTSWSRPRSIPRLPDGQP